MAAHLSVNSGLGADRLAIGQDQCGRDLSDVAASGGHSDRDGFTAKVTEVVRQEVVSSAGLSVLGIKRVVFVLPF